MKNYKDDIKILEDSVTIQCSKCIFQRKQLKKPFNLC